MPRPSEASHARLLSTAAVIVGATLMSWCAMSPALAVSEDWPKFRRGVWQFDRTLAAARPTPEGKIQIFSKQQMRRCVNPSEAMKETFKVTNIGSCHSSRPERVDNQYMFALRCDYMGPVRTTISVESDVAYTEINELRVGDLPRTDTVVAKRIADCE
jgi:hypothetical protein